MHFGKNYNFSITAKPYILVAIYFCVLTSTENLDALFFHVF